MKTLFPSAIFLAASMLMGCVQAQPTVATKPTSPVQVTIDVVQDSPESLEIKATVTSRLAGELLRITIQLPPQLQLLEGELGWRGVVAAGESRTLTVRAKALRKGGAIRAMAVIETKKYGQFGGVSVYALAKDPQSVSGVAGSTGRKVRRHGDDVIELPAR